MRVAWVKNVIVTGGEGFIGQALCRRLIEENFNVISIDNGSTGFEREKIPGVTYLKVSIEEFDFEGYEDKVDVLVHLGEYSRVEASLAHFDRVMLSNRSNFSHILTFCKRKNCKLVYGASSTLFGDDGSARYTSPYSVSKYQNVELLKAFHKWYSLQYALVYFYNVYGPNETDTGPYATVIGKFLKAKKDGAKSVKVTAPGTQQRFFTHIDDTIDALILVIRQGIGDGYGIGNPLESYSIIELTEMLFMEFELSASTQANRLKGTVNNGRTRDLGWVPKRCLSEYLKLKLSNISSNE